MERAVSGSPKAEEGSMTWLAWPALTMLVLFIAVLVPPRRRLSHYVVALAFSLTAGAGAVMMTLLIWGITR